MNTSKIGSETFEFFLLGSADFARRGAVVALRIQNPQIELRVGN